MSETHRTSSASFAAEGHCLCGAVVIEIRAPASETYHCHCSMCRRASGSLYQTYSVYPRNAIRFTTGEDALLTYESSPGTRRRFCRRCGCQVLCEVASSPDIVYLNSGILEGTQHPGHAKEREKHIFTADKVAWLEIGDGLPKFDQAP